jgi:hypothetical protein
MKARAPYALVLALLCLAAAAAAQAAPRSVRVSYNATMNGIAIGTITEQFESDGSTYRIVSDTRPQGLAAMIQRQPLRFTSSGTVAREGLRPVQFDGRRSAGEPPQVSAEFDWPHKQITLRHQGKIESFPLPPGTQDRLSVMYQFMFLAPERIRQLDFSMTNGRKIDRYRYRATDDVEIDSALGRLKTVHLVKQRDPGDTVTEVWISPQHQNLPVKMLIVEKNDVRYEQLIQSVEVRD